VFLQASWALFRPKEEGRLRTKFHELNEWMGKRKSAVSTEGRLVCLLWISVMRREFYSGLSREGLIKRLRYYKIGYER
jgi:hypothetical protein